MLSMLIKGEADSVAKTAEIADMTDAAMWALIVGAILPVFVSLVKQSTWPNYAKALVAFVVFAASGFVTAYLAGALTGKTIVSCILIVAVTAYTLFQNFYKPTGLDAKISGLTDRQPRSHTPGEIDY